MKATTRKRKARRAAWFKASDKRSSREIKLAKEYEELIKKIVMDYKPLIDRLVKEG